MKMTTEVIFRSETDFRKKTEWKPPIAPKPPNKALQQRPRSEFLIVLPLPFAAPLNGSVRPKRVMEVKRSAAGGESKKRPGGVVG
jgi:hypothetical protein